MEIDNKNLNEHKQMIDVDIQEKMFKGLKISYYISLN